jgi:hypothetical protein
MDWLRPGDFKPEGTIPYYSANETGISLVANGTVDAEFTCAGKGQYDLWIAGRATPAGGVYARVRVFLDDQSLGELEVDSPQPKSFKVATLMLSEGGHTLRISFVNDQVIGAEDRNLYLQGAAFAMRSGDSGEKSRGFSP